MLVATRVSSPVFSDADHAALHEEIASLPDRYRAPVILHHLEGKSYMIDRKEGRGRMDITKYLLS